jgi:glycosyltransferase involved in cell wall biosynthesis
MRERCAKTALFDLPSVTATYGVDLERFRPRLGARALIGEGPGLLAVTAANMYAPGDRRKGLHVLLEAWAELVAPTFPAARLNVIGTVHRSLRSRGRPVSRIRPGRPCPDAFRGGRSIRPADSRRQLSLGGARILASGCPVVATRVGGIPKSSTRVKPDGSRPDDVESLSAAILDAMSGIRKGAAAPRVPETSPRSASASESGGRCTVAYGL